MNVMPDKKNFSVKDDEALKKQDLISGYEQFAADYAASEAMQKEAEAWLNKPMEDSQSDKFYAHLFN